MSTKRIAQLVLGIFLGAAACGNSWAQKAEGLADTPPMGWNSWNKFACDIDERLIRETADAMVKPGLKDAGYQYVNIDDCWHGQRDADGNIHPDPKRFPSGMKALADYVHGKGLKLGIYSDAGEPPAAAVPAAGATSIRMRGPMRAGASITSSTTGATPRG